MLTRLGLSVVVAISTSVAPLAAADLKTPLQKKVESDLQVICVAAKLFKLDAGRLPTVSEGLAILLPNAGGRPTHLRIRPDGYFDGSPMDPWGKYGFPIDPWGRPYVYMAAGTGYRILTYGADGVPGGMGEDEDKIGCDLDDT